MNDLIAYSNIRIYATPSAWPIDYIRLSTTTPKEVQSPDYSRTPGEGSG